MKKTNNSINVTVNNATTNTIKKGDKTMKKSSKKSNKVRASKKLYFGKVNLEDVNLFLECEPVLKDARKAKKDAESAFKKAESEKDTFYRDVVRILDTEISCISADAETMKKYRAIVKKAHSENERLRDVVKARKYDVSVCDNKVEDIKKVMDGAIKKYGSRQDIIISSFNTMQWDIFDNAVVEIFESVGVRGLRASNGELNANTLPLVQSFTHMMNLRNSKDECKTGRSLVKEIFHTLSKVLVAEGYAEFCKDGEKIKLADADYSFDFANYGIQF